jgi:UDP-N-acetylglucosamine:LPS N-acetylglucosamine transferase
MEISKKPAIIMITSNGVGAGHLIRASSIARELKEEFRVIILSMANSVGEVANSLGIEYEYIPSKARDIIDKNRYDRYLAARILALIDETNAKIITFDSVVPYRGIQMAKIKRDNIKFIWIRRGLWRRVPNGVNFLEGKIFDYIIEPGDIAESYDNGPTAKRKDALRFSPVTLYNKKYALSKNAARKILKIDESKKNILIQLGINDLEDKNKITAIIKGINEYSNLEIIFTKKPSDEILELISKKHSYKIIRYFPLADVIHGFDALIGAAGYNTVHEAIPAKIPTLLIANTRGTDDQYLRAKFCSDSNLLLHASSDDYESIKKCVEELLNESAIVKNTKLQKNVELTGAYDIANFIKNIKSDKNKKTKKIKNFFIFYYSKKNIKRFVIKILYYLLFFFIKIYRVYKPRIKREQKVFKEDLLRDHSESYKINREKITNKLLK